MLDWIEGELVVPVEVDWDSGEGPKLTIVTGRWATGANMNDDELLDDLGCVLAAVDPVPEHVRAAAIAGGRDAPFERDAGAEALAVERAVACFAPAAEAASSRMVALAHARALDGPVTPNGRSFPREAREELADACNYLVWHRRLREGRGAGGAELAAVDRAIAALAVAWLELGWVG